MTLDAGGRPDMVWIDIAPARTEAEASAACRAALQSSEGAAPPADPALVPLWEARVPLGAGLDARGLAAAPSPSAAVALLLDALAAAPWLGERPLDPPGTAAAGRVGTDLIEVDRAAGRDLLSVVVLDGGLPVRCALPRRVDGGRAYPSA